jgi:5'-3' exonuclease
MFKYVRDTDNKEKELMVYGMDADLIMLSMLHNEETKGIRIYREKEKKCIVIEIKELIKGIKKEIGKEEIKEYICICFLLGNDFVPGVVALNIRRNGIEYMIETYKRMKINIIKEGKIEWNNVLKYIEELAKNERKIIIQEKKERDKREEKMRQRQGKEINIEEVVQIYRMDEHYVSPEEEYWEQRYYKRIVKGKKKDAVQNYLEGIQWIYNYYTTGCKDWLWEYKYNHAPLLTDMKYIPTNTEKERKAVSKQQQLDYVLPKKENNIKFNWSWAYKKYLWESSITYHHTPSTTLTKTSQYPSQHPSQNP